MAAAQVTASPGLRPPSPPLTCIPHLGHQDQGSTQCPRCCSFLPLSASSCPWKELLRARKEGEMRGAGAALSQQEALLGSCPHLDHSKRPPSPPSWASFFLKMDSRSAFHGPSQSRARPWSSHSVGRGRAVGTPSQQRSPSRIEHFTSRCTSPSSQDRISTAVPCLAHIPAPTPF